MAFAGTVIGRGIIPVSLDPTAIGGQVTGLQGLMNGKFGALGKGAGGAFAAGATLAIGAGIAAFKLGEEFDDSFDKIRVGTGKTGAALAGLQKDFKQVARSGPDSFDLVGTAVTDLSRRLNLTGKPLQDLSRQVLDLSRITDTDLGTNIETLTRVFGDWNIKSTEATKAMDELFRASQATGAPIDRLAALMTKFGSPMRQLGFDFETTAALVGKFEKEGVNTELVLGSMRIALGKMAKSGEPAQETLKRVTDEIKNAGTTSEANKKALELFGARAGPDMAAAIREGRFSVQDLVDTIANGKDTIKTATDDTSDFAEAWGELKNQFKVAAEPIGTATFSGLSKGIKYINDVAIPTMERYNKTTDDSLIGPNSKTGTQVGNALDELKSKQTWASVAESIGQTSKSGQFVGSVLDGIKSKSKSTWATLKSGSSSAWANVSSTARSKGGEVVSYIGSLPGRIRGAVGDLGGVLSGAGSSLIGGLLDGIKARFRDVQSTLADLTSKLPSWKGPLEVDQTILFGAGSAVMGGFIRGIESERDSVRQALGRVTAGLPQGVTAKQGARPHSAANGGLTRADLEWHANRIAALMGLATDGAINDQLAFAGTTRRMGL